RYGDQPRRSGVLVVAKTWSGPLRLRPRAGTAAIGGRWVETTSRRTFPGHERQAVLGGGPNERGLAAGGRGERLPVARKRHRTDDLLDPRFLRQSARAPIDFRRRAGHERQHRLELVYQREDSDCRQRLESRTQPGWLER